MSSPLVKERRGILLHECYARESGVPTGWSHLSGVVKRRWENIAEKYHDMTEAALQ